MPYCRPVLSGGRAPAIHRSESRCSRDIGRIHTGCSCCRVFLLICAGCSRPSGTWRHSFPAIQGYSRCSDTWHRAPRRWRPTTPPPRWALCLKYLAGVQNHRMVHLCIRGCNHDCAVLCLFIPQGGKPACKKMVSHPRSTALWAHKSAYLPSTLPFPWWGSR